VLSLTVEPVAEGTRVRGNKFRNEIGNVIGHEYTASSSDTVANAYLSLSLVVEMPRIETSKYRDKSVNYGAL
jgi:hypothetical protein